VAVLRTVNAAWRERSGDIAAALAPSFTDDAVIVGPDLQRTARGRRSVAASYAAFAASATVEDYVEGKPTVDFVSGTAVVTLPWSMTYVYEGQRSSEKGYDVYVLVRQPAWRIAWRHIVASS
jgi:hypothetical protein